MNELVPEWVVLTYLFVIGACVVSFLNVVIARLPEGLSIVHPRSRCPKCASAIAWYDNIPLVSYIALRARCRHCGTHIALRYALVELLMGALALALYARFDLSWQLLVWFVLTAIFLAIVFLDVDHFWVPDVLTFPALGVALGGAMLPGGLGISSALIGLIPALLLWAFAFAFERITGREGLGLGDVKLLAVIGAAVGALPSLTVLFLGALQGSVIGIIVLATGGHPAPREPQGDDDWVPHPRAIPFGPFLVLGCLEVVLLPDIFALVPNHIVRLLGGGA